MSRNSITKNILKDTSGKFWSGASVMSYSSLALNRTLEGIVLWWLIVISVWVINFN